MVILTIIIGFSFLAYRTYTRKLISEENTRHQLELSHQREISEQYVVIQEAERKRIAEMLHDDVGNKLNVLSLWVKNEDTWKSDRSREVISQQLPMLIEATRNISHALYPVNLEQFGLMLTLEELVVNLQGALTVEIVRIYPYRFNDLAVNVQLYRVVQEFLSNVIKHAQAGKVIIHLRDSETNLSILLSDDGVGFDPDKLHKGMGLTNIGSRLESIHARYKWKSRKGSGSRLIVLILKEWLVQPK